MSDETSPGLKLYSSYSAVPRFEEIPPQWMICKVVEPTGDNQSSRPEISFG